jgi:hypothetical protein
MLERRRALVLAVDEGRAVACSETAAAFTVEVPLDQAFGASAVTLSLINWTSPSAPLVRSVVENSDR